MKDITDLDNPNSVVQMKSWLSDNGLETETLGKKAVATLDRGNGRRGVGGAVPPAAACQIIGEKVSGHAECRLQG